MRIRENPITSEKTLHNIARRKRVRNLRAWFFRLKSSMECVDCKEGNPIVLEFDHVRGVKKYNISTMVNAGVSRASLLDEMSKCEVVCSNCHKIRTHERRHDSVDAA